MVWKIYKSILVILKADVLKLQFFFKFFFFCILYLFILFIYLFIYLFKYVYYFCYTHFVNTNLKLLLSINCECVWICNTCDAINFHFSYTKEHGHTHSRVGQHVASSRNATRGCRAVQRGSLSSGTTRLCILFPFQKITYEITIFLEFVKKSRIVKFNRSNRPIYTK